MYLPDFDYLAPDSLQDVCNLLAEHAPDALVLSGGTDLMVSMKHGLVEPKILVSLRNLEELRNIRHEPGTGVVIGARTTHNEIMNSPILHERYLSVSEAAHSMAATQVRNTGTIGGNIANAIPSADLPPILISLGATVTLHGCEGERTLPLEGFFTGPRKSVLKQDEVITHVTIPDHPVTGSTYLKFGLRRAGALAVVGVAAAVNMEGNTVRDCRIALGAVAPVPLRAREAEAVLKDKEWTEELLEEAGQKAAAESSPISDIRGSQEYRRDMVRIFTRRALRKAITEGHV